VIVWVALAAATPREDGDTANTARDYAAALTAWRTCAESSPDRDARYCAARVALVAPQAADGFAGWAVLDEVRSDYRTLGSEAAIAKIEAALAAMPDSPAAPAMRLWLVNERSRRNETAEVARLGAEIRDDPRSSATDRAFTEAQVAFDAREATRRRWGLAAGAVGAVYVLVAALRRGPLRWRSAALAALALDVVPAVFAELFEEGRGDGFLYSGGTIALGVLLAGRAPVWVAVPGTLGGFAAAAWANGWYPSLGLG
jgi:hypothetical protein